ncbi:MAG: glycoside hydrolase [Adhaeribacter sp.]
MFKIFDRLKKQAFFKPATVLFTCLLVLTGCKQAPGEVSDNSQQAPEPTALVQIDATKRYQRISNFAASDAWACQFVGNWPNAKKNAIADLLFSTELDNNGQPKGIGLSLWRFNLGAGSAQQGEQSGIKDAWRRAESFLNTDGSYNWQQQAGQVWFLKAAQQRGVKEFLAFPNSPPVNFTINQKAYATNGVPNLAPAQYDAFADYMADVMQGMERVHGIKFNYISPVNEPQWDWSDGGQEGTPFMNEHIAGIVRALNTSLARRNLQTKIDIAEAGKINYLYEVADKPNRGNQIDAFFNNTSPDYLGDLPQVSKVISGHSYFTTSPVAEAIAARKALASKVASVPGLAFWQSEYCILGDNAGEINGNKRDLGMNSALYLARVIHNDLVFANASAWQWWLAISPYDYKDGLIYIDKQTTDGNYYESKMLWALGNYSRFIRPGAERLEVHLSGGPREADNLLVASSYLDQAQNKLITVLVNQSIKPVPVQLRLTGAGLKNINGYVTSETSNLKPRAIQNIDEAITVDARSVITLVSDLQ